MTQAEAAIEELRKAIGVESEPVTYEVEKGHIRRFAEAIGDPNPLFNDEVLARKTRYGGIIAPPTFFRSLIAKPLNVDSPYQRRLDGGSDWEYFHPVRPGDRITVTLRLADVTQREGRLGSMLFLVRETRYVNQFGELVATQRATGISY